MRITTLCETCHLHEGFRDMNHSMSKDMFEVWTDQNHELFLVDHEDPRLSRLWCHLVYYYHLDPRLVAKKKQRRKGNANDNDNDNHHDQQRAIVVGQPDFTPLLFERSGDMPSVRTARQAVIRLLHLTFDICFGSQDGVTFSGRTHKEVSQLASLVAVKYGFGAYCKLWRSSALHRVIDGRFLPRCTNNDGKSSCSFSSSYLSTTLMYRVQRRLSLLRALGSDHGCYNLDINRLYRETAHVIDAIAMPDLWRMRFLLQIMSETPHLKHWHRSPITRHLIGHIFGDPLMLRISVTDSVCFRSLHKLIDGLYRSKDGHFQLPPNIDILTIESHERRSGALLDTPLWAPLRIAMSVISESPNDVRNLLFRYLLSCVFRRLRVSRNLRVVSEHEIRVMISDCEELVDLTPSAKELFATTFGDLARSLDLSTLTRSSLSSLSSSSESIEAGSLPAAAVLKQEQESDAKSTSLRPSDSPALEAVIRNHGLDCCDVCHVSVKPDKVRKW